MNKEPKYVGVDISKEYLDMAVVEPDNKWRFGNNAYGIGKAVKAERDIPCLCGV